MNSKIIIPISVVITIIIVIFSLTQSKIIEEQTSSEIGDTSEIQSTMDKIKNDKIKMMNQIIRMYQLKENGLRQDHSQ